MQNIKDESQPTNKKQRTKHIPKTLYTRQIHEVNGTRQKTKDKIENTKHQTTYEIQTKQKRRNNNQRQNTNYKRQPTNDERQNTKYDQRKTTDNIRKTKYKKQKT